MPTVGWWKIILFRPIQLLFIIDGNLLHIYAGAKRCSREEELVNCGGGKGNVGGEEHAKILLGRSSLNRCVHPKSDWQKGVSTRVVFLAKPNLRHLRVFDNIAYVHVPNEKRRKLDAKLEKCILVGY